MECIPKCTEMLQVNQPIRVQPEVRRNGWRGEVVGPGQSMVQHCLTKMEVQYNTYKKCVQSDA